MNDKKSLSKYRVYFFLYLAVVCELLIIIVERDDAEAAWLREKAELQEMTRKVILELLSLAPTGAASGNNQMKVGETREFFFAVKGLGRTDSITIPPRIVIRRGGVFIDSFDISNNQFIDSTIHGNGERVYTFRWTARQAGSYEFRGTSGTDRIGLRSDGDVKIGTLDFPMKKIERYAGDISSYLNKSQNISATLKVDVIASGDPLKIGMRDVVTAVGFPTTLPIEVEGTIHNRVVSMIPSLGKAVRNANGQWLWDCTLTDEGQHLIRLQARDNRGEAAIGSAETSFRVTAKLAYLVRSFPKGAFAGERFEMGIRVQGLETVGHYAWTLRLGNAIVAQGNSDIVRWNVPDDALGKSLTLIATYQGKPYPVLKDSATTQSIPSEFSFPVLSAPYHIIRDVLRENAALVSGSEVHFIVTRCGDCVMENRRGIERTDIRLEVEDHNGNDMLDGNYQLEPIVRNGNEIATRVVFLLKKMNKRRTVEAVVSISTPTERKNIPITIVKE